MPIPKQIVDQIIQAVDIVDIVGRFVVIKKKGRNYVGLSPWGVEKTPSFNVVVDKQIFKDFSSGKGGNVITFLMEHPDTKYNFFEAMDYLAKEAGIDIPKDNPRKSNEPKVFKDRLIELNAWACQYFESCLRNDGTQEDGSAGLDYLKIRGFNDAVIRQFRIGFSLSSWHAFFHAGKAQGFSNLELQYAGLINFSKKIDEQKKRTGKYYDTFRNRLMFPVINSSGNIITFGGRVIGEAGNDRKSEGKYLNGRNNTLHKKSRSLYGINIAKREMRLCSQAILVEGYLDVVALHQAKVGNTIGSLGTAFTAYHAEEIKKYSNSVNVIFDSDSAGQKATKSATDILLGEGLEVYITVLPEGQDPQSFLAAIPYPKHLQLIMDTAIAENREFDFTAAQYEEIETHKGDTFKAYLNEHRKPFLNYIIDTRYTPAKTPDEKAKVLKQLLYTLSRVKDSFTRVEHCKDVAKQTLQDVEIIKAEVEKVKSDNEQAFMSRMAHKKDVGRVGRGEADILRMYLLFYDLKIGADTLGNIILSNLKMIDYEFTDNNLDNLYAVLTALSENDVPPTLEAITDLNKRAGAQATTLNKNFKLEDFLPSRTGPGYHPDMCNILNNHKKTLINYRLKELETMEKRNPIQEQVYINLLGKIRLYK
jgi:DNA primase catalytic core